MGEIEISDEAQDLLEKCWVDHHEHGNGKIGMITADDRITGELTRLGYAYQNSTGLGLTDKGETEAKNCIRRHRLAERLFADVLDIQGQQIEEMGCKFEHLLQQEVEENICSLLGHPTVCPHNKPIPPGDCCRGDKRGPRKIVRPLSECDVNEKGKIAYLKTDHNDLMNKLTALGVLPGLSIQLLRKTPGYLFQMGESQFVVDGELASKIQVRFSK